MKKRRNYVANLFICICLILCMTVSPMAATLDAAMDVTGAQENDIGAAEKQEQKAPNVEKTKDYTAFYSSMQPYFTDSFVSFIECKSEEKLAIFQKFTRGEAYLFLTFYQLYFNVEAKKIDENTEKTQETKEWNTNVEHLTQSYETYILLAKDFALTTAGAPTPAPSIEEEFAVERKSLITWLSEHPNERFTPSLEFMNLLEPSTPVGPVGPKQRLSAMAPIAPEGPNGSHLQADALEQTLFIPMIQLLEATAFEQEETQVRNAFLSFFSLRKDLPVSPNVLSPAALARLSSSATIKGISYNRGTPFVAATSAIRYSSSDGGAQQTRLTQGQTYYFYGIQSASAYPYAISDVSSASYVYCFVGAEAFPQSGAYQIGWNQDSNGWWYSPDGSTYYKSRWATIANEVYYFDANGYIKTGLFQEPGTNNWWWSESGGQLREATVYHVGGGYTNYRTLQDAVKAAGNNDKIEINATYVGCGEGLVIDKNLTIGMFGPVADKGYITIISGASSTLTNIITVKAGKTLTLDGTKGGDRHYLTLQGAAGRRGIDNQGGTVNIKAGVQIKNGQTVSYREYQTALEYYPGQSHNQACYGEVTRWVAGGGIYNTGTLTITGTPTKPVHINNNKGGGGGGIQNNRGTLRISHALVYQNEADGCWALGGGIENAGNAVIEDSDIYNNRAPGGGGISGLGGADSDPSKCFLANTSISNCSIYGNQVETRDEGLSYGQTWGAGVLSFADNMSLTNCIIRDNKTNLSFNPDPTYFDWGGGIEFLMGAGNHDNPNIYQNGSVTMSGCEVSNNSARNCGGISLERPWAKINITNTKVHHNQASETAGGIYIYRGMETAVTLPASLEVYQNTAQRGAGIYVLSTASAHLAANVHHNTASQYGAGILNEGVTTLIGANIHENTASTCGGGIQNSKTLRITNASIHDNTAETYGGGINNESTITMDNGTILGNKAMQGAGVRNWGTPSTFTMKAGTITGNIATGEGGGVSITKEAAFHLQGGSIKDNRAAKGNAVYQDALFQASGNPAVVGDVFLTPAHFITIVGQISAFTCSMDDVFENRVLAHYVLTNANEKAKYSLQESTNTAAKNKYLGIEEGALAGSAYPFSIYLKKNLCKVNYQNNGGVGVMKSDIVPMTEPYTLRENEFTYVQHAYSGWGEYMHIPAGQESLHPGDVVDLSKYLDSIKKSPRSQSLFAPRVIAPRTINLQEFAIQKAGEALPEVTLYAIWDNPPEITSGSNEFYEGQKIGKAYLMQELIRGLDDKDGTITDKICIKGIRYQATRSGYKGTDETFQTEMPANYILDTYRGKGMQEDECITNVLTYSLTDSAGNETLHEENIFTNFNHAPEIMANPVIQYFTQDIEKAAITNEGLLKKTKAGDLEDNYYKNAGRKDDDGNPVDIQSKLSIVSVNDEAGNAIAPESITGVGNYSVTFTVTDQWGKTTEKQVPILVENKDDYRKTHYYTRFISLDYLWTLAPDSKWTEEELRSLMTNPTPVATIDLTHADVKEIQRIALEGGYLQSKEQTEAVIREVTAKYVDAAFDATGH